MLGKEESSFFYTCHLYDDEGACILYHLFCVLILILFLQDLTNQYFQALFQPPLFIIT